ncbi:MAG: hypothetical protein HQL95_07010 [Magnetococcales bacterium]|nr:hypothetical protein [Magnetococcales bacterium]
MKQHPLTHKPVIVIILSACIAICYYFSMQSLCFAGQGKEQNELFVMAMKRVDALYQVRRATTMEGMAEEIDMLLQSAKSWPTQEQKNEAYRRAYKILNDRSTTTTRRGRSAMLSVASSLLRFAQ